MKKLFALLILVVGVSTSWASNFGEYITVNNLQYIIDYDAQQALFNRCDAKLSSLVIPATIVSNNRTYHVVGIDDDAYINPSVTSITIEDGNMTSIGKNAFATCDKLVTLKLPSSLTSLSAYAFAYCQAKNIVLPDGITNMGEYVFYKCGATNIKLPTGITSIPQYAFYQCPNLASLSIPEGVTSLGVSCIQTCDALKTLALPNSLTAIGDNAIMGLPVLESVTLPNRLKTLGEYSFYDCPKLEQVVFPASLTAIGDQAFSLTGLKAANLPNGLKTIGESAFEMCEKLESATIPRTVTSLGSLSFGYNPAMKRFYIYAPTVLSYGSSKFSGVNVNQLKVFLTNENYDLYRAEMITSGSTSTTNRWSARFGTCMVKMVKCDTDGNSIVDVSDVNETINLVLNKGNAAYAAGADNDINGTIDVSDLTNVLNTIVSK